MTPRVLFVSRDQMLLQTRMLILGAFFQVEGAGRVKEAEILISKYRFDLIVLCYSLSEEECQQVHSVVEQQDPPPKILLLSAAGSKPALGESDRAMMCEAGPYHLLKKSAELLGVDLRVKAKLAAA